MTIYKQSTVADSQLFSGSGDTTMDALGLSIGSSMSEIISSYVERLSGSTGNNAVEQTTFFYRLTGNRDKIENDKHWQTFVAGGEYANEPVTGIFNEVAFADHYHDELNPYSLRETKENNTLETQNPSYILAQPRINHYYPKYQEYIEDLTTVTEIPNAYILTNDPIRTRRKDLKRELNFELPNGKIEINQTSSLQENLLFASQEAYDKMSDLQSNFGLLPNYVDFEFTFDSIGDFTRTAVENNYTHRFIKILKNTFLGQDRAPRTSEAQFIISSREIGTDGTPVEAQENVTVTIADVFDILDYSLRSYNTETDNFQYLLDDSLYAKSEYDKKSVRRYEKSIPTLKQLNAANKLLQEDSFQETFRDDPLRVSQKYNETIAYRIEKIGGPPTGDAQTQQTIQNFWFMNLAEVEDFKYVDSQISYGNSYTYNIYKYVLVAGISYQYSNLVLSNTIAKLGSQWCLEMFEASTGTPTAPIFDDSNLLETDLATGAQIKSKDRYLADFQLDVIPSVKIIEVPLLSKQIDILDAPTNQVGVAPFYLLDDSQTIGFNVRYETVISRLFPTTIGADEAEYKINYLNSYDLLDDEEFDTESVSKPITLQIYKLNQKPNSLDDFEGNLMATKSLKMLNHDAVFANTTIYDRINANTKYYYLFRIINEVESPGYASVVIEAEMVSDGGYKFANFESFFPEQLGEKTFSRTTEQFKKLINLIPNIKNFVVNEENADFSNEAETEIQNVTFGANGEDLVWNKKFKIRLTSRKTGKQLDLNLTYKLDGE